jgi:hypothetical protein
MRQNSYSAKSMDLRKIKVPFLALLFMNIVAAALAAAPAANARCDRECLRGFISKYLDAMLSHNPDMLSRSAEAKFTEDSEAMKPGEGLWRSVSGVRIRRSLLIIGMMISPIVRALI